MSTTPADIIDTDPEASAAQETAAAFSAPAFRWKDITLHPFAIGRESAWMLHRHMIGAPELNDVITNVGAVLPDALRVLWFCAHDPAEWISAPGGEMADGITFLRFTPAERAQRLEMRITEWSSDLVDGSEINSAVSLFYQLLTTAHSTRATHVSEGRSDTSKN